MNHPASRAATAWAWAFAVVAAAHLAALAVGAAGLAVATKPLLMPLLARHVLARGGGRWQVAALLCGCAGDTLLELGDGPAFLCGMGAFAAGHLCYLHCFARPVERRPAGRWVGPTLTVAYGALWAGVVAALWPGLPPALRLPVAGYSLLLTAVARAAWRRGPAGATGGALFLLSDTLIAAGLAHWPSPPGRPVLIMGTYLTAQCLLALALLGGTQAGGGPRPARAYGGRSAAV